MGFDLCMGDAARYKQDQNKACHYLASAVGNIPHANPAGACYGRVTDAYDVMVSNCNIARSYSRATCIK